MTATTHFEDTLHFHSSSAAQEFYERNAGLIFEKEESDMNIEVRCLTKRQLDCYRKYSEILQASEDNDITSQAVTTADAVVVRLDEQHCDQEADIHPAENTSIRMRSETGFESDDPPKDENPLQWNMVDLDVPKLQSIIRVSYLGNFTIPWVVINSMIRQRDRNSECCTTIVCLVVNCIDSCSYIRQRHSYSRLKITKEVFRTLLTEVEAFPKLTEYLINFRWRMRDAEIGPLPIRFRLTSDKSYGLSLRDHEIWSNIPTECAYIVRYIEFTNRKGKEPWSLRQFVIYHKYNPTPEQRCSTWFLMGATQRTDASLDGYVEHVGDLNNAHPFELHLIFLDTAIASWRPYLVDLAERISVIVS